MRFVRISEDMFHGTSENELGRINSLKEVHFLLFVNNPKKAYDNAEEKAREDVSSKVIIHLNNGYFLTNESKNRMGQISLSLGNLLDELNRLGLARLYGGGEVRIYKGEGMDGIGYFRTVYLNDM